MRQELRIERITEMKRLKGDLSTWGLCIAITVRLSHYHFRNCIVLNPTSAVVSPKSASADEGVTPYVPPTKNEENPSQYGKIRKPSGSTKPRSRNNVPAIVAQMIA